MPDAAVSQAGPGAGSTGHPPSYYAATAAIPAERPPLEGDVTVDVCIVGGGFTGLAAGLELVRRGRRVLLLEAARIGWGASGRNGGQLVNGLSADLDTIARHCGRDGVQRVLEAGPALRELIARNGIDCDLTPGCVFAAMTPGQMRGLEARAETWRRHGFEAFRLLDRTELAGYVRSAAYLGGMADPSGGHLHPLRLVLGEAAAFETLGGVIHERSPVIRVEDIAGRPVVHAAGGTVRPEVLILAGNAYLGHAVPVLENRIMPFSTQVIATEPLGARAAALIPSGYSVEDERYIQDYYRISADGRLLFGGGAVFGGTDPADIRRKLVPHLTAVFPELRGVAIDFAWSGNCAISFSRIPQIGQLGPAAYFAQGYSGHGIIGSHLFGRLLGEAVAGEREGFETFARVPWARFPGGRRFAAPYTLLGSWWYDLRDQLDM